LLSKKDFLTFGIIATAVALGVFVFLFSYKNNNDILQIVEAPYPTLRKVSPQIEHIDSAVISISNDMVATLRYQTLVDVFSKKTIPRGLAAPQVGISKRLIVCGLHGEIKVLINPRILEKRGIYESNEGCLSVHGGEVNQIKRSAYVKLQYTGLDNREKILVVRNRNAALLEHEIDHLNGVLNVDYVAEN